MSIKSRKSSILNRSFGPVVQMLETRRLMSAGDLDFSFSSDGKAVVDLPGSTNEFANATVVQSDGKVIVAGRATVGTETDFFVARLNENGSVDSSFGGGDGVTLIDFQVNDEAMDVTLSGSNIVVVGTSSSGAGSNARKFAVARLTTAGVLDNTFSGDGKVLVDFGINADAQAVAIDGSSIYVGGYKDLGTTGQFALVRLTSTGAEDTTYSADGEVFFGFGGNNDSRCFDIAVDSSHRVLMVGYDEALSGSTARNFAYARVGTNALLDPAFSGDGLAVTDFAAGDDEARAVGIDFAGRITVGGFSDGTGGDDFAATRLNDAGALDSSFNGDGEFRLNLGGVEQCDGLAVSPDGMVTLSGGTSFGGFQAAVVQIQQFSGQLNTGFGDGGDGIQLIDFGGIDDGFALALAADLKPVVAGTDGSGKLAVGRLHDLVDHSWSDDSSVSSPSEMIMLPDGKLLVENGSTVRRYLPDGSLDPTFTVIHAPGNMQAMAVDGAGRIVLGGDAAGTHTTVASVARFLPDGAVDLSFSGDGVMTFSFLDSFQESHIHGIATDAQNRIAVCGETTLLADTATARITTTGVLDSSFNGNGINVVVLTIDNPDIATRVLVQPDGKVVVVGDRIALSGSLSSFVMRFDEDGDRDLGFSGAGVNEVGIPGSFSSETYALALDNAGRILMGGIGLGVGPDVGFLIRFEADGDLDNTFGGGDGKVTTLLDANGDTEQITDIALDAAGNIYTAGLADTGGAYRTIVRKFNSAGTSGVFDFAGDGTYVVPPGAADAHGSLFARPQITLNGAVYIGGGDRVVRLNVAPAVTDFDFKFQGSAQFLRVHFNDDVGDSLTNFDLILQNLTDNVQLSPTAYTVTSFDRTTNIATINFNGVLADGNYAMTFVSSGIENRQGMNLAGDNVKEFFFLNADANLDRKVNTLDFNILAGNFGASGRTFVKGNFNYDASGLVNSLDFNILVGHYGKSFPAAGAVSAPIVAGPQLFSSASLAPDDETTDFE